MNKTTNGFNRLSWAEFRKQLGVIVDSTTGNPYFPALQSQVAALSASADKYYVLDTKAEKRDKDVILARNTGRIEITNVLHELGLDVTAVAKGDVTVLSSSGFPYTKPAQKTLPLQKPAPPKVSSGINNGDIACKTTPQKGTKAVNYYITSDAAALAAGADVNWDVTSWNSTRYTFSNLTPGQRYYIKVGLIGVRGQEAISDTVSYIPQ
jgi:hypothetical protein